jgi:hypothetical protein
MILKKTYRLCAMCCLSISFCAGSALANPGLIGLGDFSNSATVIDFNSIGNEVPITNQYSSGQGVAFSGALYGMTNFGDTALFPANGGGVIASNWLYSRGANQGLSFVADFASPVNKVGFYLENWANQTGTLEIFNGVNSLGSITYNTQGLTAEFVGLENSSLFNRLVFTNTANTNGFYAIDDFRFESTGSQVPEPATMLLFGAGLAGLAVVRRKKTA